MILLERTAVMNLENAMRGARNPMNSWNRSDSYYNEANEYVLGPNDLGLAMRLRKAGSDHRKFIRQIFVSVDITAPLYWWKEYDTYKVATVANSTSTMHKIHAKPFELSDFSHEKLTERGLRALEDLIAVMEQYRTEFIAQMRTCTLNYETLVNIYYARRNHKLEEWHTFCDWIRTLPYADQLILGLDPESPAEGEDKA